MRKLASSWEQVRNRQNNWGRCRYLSERAL
jgi:hypothetical protein